VSLLQFQTDVPAVPARPVHQPSSPTHLMKMLKFNQRRSQHLPEGTPPTRKGIGNYLLPTCCLRSYCDTFLTHRATGPASTQNVCKESTPDLCGATLLPPPSHGAKSPPAISQLSRLQHASRQMPKVLVLQTMCGCQRPRGHNCKAQSDRRRPLPATKPSPRYMPSESGARSPAAHAANSKKCRNQASYPGCMLPGPLSTAEAIHVSS